MQFQWQKLSKEAALIVAAETPALSGLTLFNLHGVGTKSHDPTHNPRLVHRAAAILNRITGAPLQSMLAVCHPDCITIGILP